jgi:integration host factor subunit beta
LKKTDLILRLSEKSDLPKADTKKALGLIIEELSQAIATEDGVEVRGFGTFSKKRRLAHQGINPKTGERIQIDEKFLPFFKPGKILKEVINNS